MKITIIGGGAMGGAIAEGMCLSDSFRNDDITVSDPSQSVLDKFAAKGVHVMSDNCAAVAGAQVVMVVVKPWLVEQVVRQIIPHLTHLQVLVMIAAGVKSCDVLDWLQEAGKETKLFLCIPNIAIAQLSSMTFLVPAKASQADSRLVKGIFDRLGHTLITDEQHLAAGTTLASCGIAYVMRYIRAAAEGGVELGFKADDAKQIVMQTMRGAVELLEASGMHPEQAIDLVTTPGGVTIKGLNEMEHAGFTSAVIRGLKAGMKS
jgi:pyrroline-5-carboxylate reductase